MEFNFNVNNLLADVITRLDSEIKPARRNADGYDSQGLQNLLITVIDKMGQASSKAQGLYSVITSGRKLQFSDHILYIMKDPSGNNGRGSVVGILKVGHKKLFVYSHHGNVHEMEPLCVLDFYVHESRQRMGCGRKLFDFMLQDQGCLPQHLAIDKPSFKFSEFLCKHYRLRAVVPQVNNFVIFEGFFTNRPDMGVKRRPGGLGRPPSHPNKRREHGPEETFNRQNTANGYGLPPVHPRVGSGNRVRSRPGSGSGDIVNAVSNHTTPRNDRIDYQRNGTLRPISASGDDEKAGVNSTREQGRQVYSRLSNRAESPQLIRPSPPPQRPSSNKLSTINQNINQNALTQNALNRDSSMLNRNNSSLLHRNDSELLQRNELRLLHRNNSAELHRTPPLLKRNVTADDYLQNMNLHQDYQGRRGHMRVNTMIDGSPVRNPFLSKEEERQVQSPWRPPPEQKTWTPFNRDPGYLSIAARNYTHTKLW